jgi:hypothetical protein
MIVVLFELTKVSTGTYTIGMGGLGHRSGTHSLPYSYIFDWTTDWLFTAHRVWSRTDLATVRSRFRLAEEVIQDQ